jgi:hypothetical protein
MARICKDCRQPVGKDERDHDCLADEPEPAEADDDGLDVA